MLIDANQIQQDMAADVCIIGAGPAGLTLAMRLLRKGVDTVVLTGGGENPDPAHQSLAHIPQTGIPTDDTTQGNIRALGGTSHVWGGYCLRMESIDFAPRPWIPNSGWPITLSELDPFYAQAAQVCGIENPDYEPAHHLTGEQVAGGELLQSPILKNLVIHVRPVRFGPHYLQELRAAKTTKVCLHGIAVELESDPGARHVTAVRCRTLTGQQFRVRARVVVLATGALQNARLLLCSRAANPKGLGNKQGVVGRYFMQHPVHRQGSLLTTDPAATSRFARSGKTPEVGIAAAFTENLQIQHQLPSCHFLLAGFDYTLEQVDGLRTRGRLAWRRLKRLYLQPAAQQDVPRLMTWIKRGDSSLASTAFGPIYLRPEQVPMPESRIVISEELDRLGMPMARMDWRLSELDWQFADRCLSWIGCAAGSEGIGRVHAARGASREAAARFLHGGFHYYGTTRMNRDPRLGVVDRNCKVHGIDNLYVTGGSVFPTSGYANPTFTIIALALRLADHLQHSR